MKKIHIIARITAKAGCEEALRVAMLTLLEPTHAEAGCESYRIYVTEPPGKFIVDETWVSQEALDLHMKTPHFVAVASRFPELIQGELEIDFLKEIGV